MGGKQRNALSVIAKEELGKAVLAVYIAIKDILFALHH